MVFEQIRSSEEMNGNDYLEIIESNEQVIQESYESYINDCKTEEATPMSYMDYANDWVEVYLQDRIAE